MTNKFYYMIMALMGLCEAMLGVYERMSCELIKTTMVTVFIWQMLVVRSLSKENKTI